MASVSAPVSELLVIAKSREIQRGLFAEMAGDRKGAKPHLLAGAHLELVLADDYETAGETKLAVRSLISAASCFWRAGEPQRGESLLNELLTQHPARAVEIQRTLDQLRRDHPAGT